MSVKTDVVNLVITVNGNDAKKKFYDLQATAAELRSELKNITKGTDEWIAKSKELKAVEKSISEVRKEVDLTDLSIKDLGKEIKKLKSVRDSLDPTSQGFKDMSAQIKTAETRMAELRTGGNFLSRTFDFMKKEALGFGVVMLGALGIDYVISKVGNLISKNAELSDSFADVRKTTGLTAKEVEEFNKDLKGLNTRTPRKELLDLAVEAGKLNITGKKNILEFVETANKIKVALGQDLGEGAVTQLTKLTQIFQLQEKQGLSLSQSLTKVGNVINQIGQQSTASEGYIVDFLSRTGPIGAQADMTIQQLTALASASDQLNLSAEVTATTFNQVLPDMFTNTAAYANVAGVSTAEFARILNTDANEAFILFLKGLNGNNEGLGMMAQKLKDVKIDGTRGIAVLAALAKNTEKIETALSSANKEFSTGSSMLQEYNLRNQNFAANVEKVKKGISGWFQSSDMVKFFQEAFGWMSKFFNVPLSKKLEEERSRLYQIEIQLKNTNLKHEDRLKLLKELQDKYPAYFKNMDLEKTGNIEISKAIALVNKELINKIVIQKKQEEIDKANEKTADALTKQLERQQQLELKMADIAKKYKLEIPAGASTLEQAIKLYQQADKILDKGSGNAGRFLKGGILDPLYGLGQAIKMFPFVESELERNNKKVEDLLKQKADLEKRLGISADTSTATTTTATTAADSNTSFTPEVDDKKAKKAAEDLQKFLKELEKLRQEARRASISVIQEELQRELDLLELEKEQKNAAVNEERDRLIVKANNLRQGNAVIEQINTDSFAQIVANNEEFEKKKSEITERYNKEAKQKAYNIAIDELNNSDAAKRLLYSRLFTTQQITESEHNAKIAEMESDHYNQLLLLANKYGVDDTKIKQDIADRQEKLLKDDLARKAQLILQQADFQVQLAEFNYENGRAKPEDVFEAKFKQLQAHLADEVNAVGITEEEKFQIYQEYNFKKDELDRLYRETKMQKDAEYYDMASGIASNMFNQILSYRQQQISSELDELRHKTEIEQAEVEKQYKNRLISDTEYQRRKKAGQDKIDREERAAKRKAAIANKVATIFNIGLSTGQAIMSALSAVPWTFMNIVNSALAGTLGAIQLGMAAAQPIPQFFDGGYTQKVKGAQDGLTYGAKLLPGFENGYLSNPSLVLAGEKGPEYFVNNTMLQKPAVAHVVQGIEAMSRGKLTYMDFVNMLALPSLQQKYTGGFTDNTAVNTPSYTSDNTNGLLGKALDVIDKLNKKLDEPIKAQAYIPDKTITDFNERNDYLKSIEEAAN